MTIHASTSSVHEAIRDVQGMLSSLEYGNLSPQERAEKYAEIQRILDATRSAVRQIYRKARS